MAALIFFICASLLAQESNPSIHPSGSSLSGQELFRQVSPSVFVVEVLDDNGSVVALGSGVALRPTQTGDQSSLIVTNTHVIDPGKSIRVRQGDRTWQTEIDHIELHADITRLRVSGLSAPGVNVRLAATLAVGERVYSIGSPEGLELTMSDGLISGLRDLNGEPVIQTTAAISHGSSGGGLFDAQGRLVGITTFMFAEGQSLNFALPVDSVREPRTPRDFELIGMHDQPALTYSEAVKIFGKDKTDTNLKDIKLCEEGLKKNPADSHAHAILGDRLLDTDPHRAVRELNEALEEGKEDGNLHFDLALALRKVGDFCGAVAELRKSAQLDPNEPGTHLTLMQTLMEDEAETPLVLHEVRTTARLKPGWAFMFFGEAKWTALRGDKQAALAICDYVMKARDSDGHYCLGLVQWLGTPQDKERSVAELRESVQLEPRAANFHHTLAIALELTHDYDAAVAEYKVASELYATDKVFKADYERTLRQLQVSSATGDKKAVPPFSEFQEERRRLELEMGCDDIIIGLECPNQAN